MREIIKRNREALDIEKDSLEDIIVNLLLLTNKLLTVEGILKIVDDPNKNVSYVLADGVIIANADY